MCMEDVQMFPALEKQGSLEDEQKLVRDAQRNLHAFEILYQRYVSRIYNYVLIRIKQREDASDLTQQIFLKALNALPNYRDCGAPFAVWLFSIARHAVTDQYRRRKKTVSWE